MGLVRRAFKDIPDEDNDVEKLAFDLFCKLVESHQCLGRDWEEAVRKVKVEKGQIPRMTH